MQRHELGENPGTAVANWTVDRLMSVVNGAAQKANHEGQRLKSNTSRISELFKRLDKVPAGVARDRARAKLQELSRKQAKTIVDHKAFVTRWKDVVGKARTWMQSIGLHPPEFSLSGLSAVPLVPIALAIGVGAVVAYIATLTSANNAMSQSIEGQDKALNAYLDGRLTFDEYQGVADNLNRALDTGADASANPIERTIKSLMPLAGIVLAILVLPKVLEMFPAGRRARA